MALDLVRLTETDSSMVESIKYNYALSTLVVTFVSGKMYRFDGVPSDVYRQLTEASSTGKAFNSLVKDQYTFQKLSDEPQKQTLKK